MSEVLNDSAPQFKNFASPEAPLAPIGGKRVELHKLYAKCVEHVGADDLPYCVGGVNESWDAADDLEDK